MKLLNHSYFKRGSNYIQSSIVALLFVILVLGLIGFVWRWAWLIIKPTMVFPEFYSVVDDLFSLLLLYEMLDLLRTLSPTRLLDLLLTILARRILLSRHDSSLILETVVFSVFLLMRLLWSRYARKEGADADKHQGE